MAAEVHASQTDNPDRFPIAVAITLLAAPALFIANYVANHIWPPLGSRSTYTIVVILLTGTLLPCVALLSLARRDIIDLRRWGYDLRPLELVKIAIALSVAGAIAAFQVGTAIRSDPAHAALLFVWLIGASLAEVLVFCGIVHNAIATITARWLPRWAATFAAAIVASLAFGVYHYSHAPPWNALPTAATLTVVWLAVSAIFVLAHSLWAAAAFNAVMATTGFIVNDVTRLDDQSLGAGLGFAAASIVVVFAAPVVARTSQHALSNWLR